MMLDVAGHQVGHQAIELSVVGEHDMAPTIPGEPGGVDGGGCQPAGSVGCFEHSEIRVLQLREFTGAREAARAGTDDHHLAAAHWADDNRVSKCEVARV